MATVLDVSLLQSFDVVIAFVFLFSVVFALLSKTKLLGDSLAVNLVISVMIGFMSLISRTVVDLITFTVPWFVIAAIFFLLLLMLFKVFGASDNNIFDYMKNDRAVGWILILVSLVIMGAGFGQVLGQDFTSASFGEDVQQADIPGSSATSSFDNNIVAIFFNAKVLGLMILFVIAVMTVGLLSGGEKWSG